MHRNTYMLLLGIVLVAYGGCRGADGLGGPRAVASTPSGQAAPNEVGVVEPDGTITLRDALALAMLQNPELRTYPYDLRAAEARVLQAGLWPNPELEIEVEEFAGSGERSGFDATETTVQVGQPIELGGKRDKRVRVASLDKELVHWDYESARLDVIRDVRQAFAAVLAAQDRVALAESLLDLSREAHGAVAQRVEAGKDSPVDELRAGVVLSKSRIELQKAQEALSVARHNLAAAWGDRTVSFERAAGDFYEVSPLAPPEDSVAEVAANPDIARWETQEQRQRAALRLEKARAAPDVIIGGGVQRFEETDDSALVFGLSVPIPLFDRNQGGIREAIANLGKTRRQYEAVLVRTLAALSNATGALAGAYDEVAILRDDVLPKAQQAFEAAQEGYQQGKFDYLYVLDTQRTLFEVQAQYLDSVEAWHKARAVVERLVGGTMRAADADHSSNASQEDSSREDSNEE
jgi:cobalt-zinc-cadmium efflux system outer membrane protein